jgi:hypothetical protein
MSIYEILRFAQHDTAIPNQQEGVLMKPIHIILLLALVMVTTESIPARAQPGSGNEPPRLTLEQAVRTAMENHPILQSTEFAVQSAEARVKQAQ